MKLKKWHKWIVFFVVLYGSLFLLDKAFEFGIRHNLNIKSSYITAHKIDADLLVLGPCEPLWMVSPEVISENTALSCYNLGESHSDFADNYLDLYLYCKNNKMPDYLLVYVTPESFDTNYNTFHTYRFAPFLKDEVISHVVNDCRGSGSLWEIFPFMRFGHYNHQTAFSALQGWKHFLSGKEKPHYPDGFEPPAKIVWDNHHENLKKAYPSGYKFTWNALREKYFEKLLDFNKGGKTKVILYESPVLQEIADYQVNRAEFLERIEKMAKNHGIP